MKKLILVVLLLAVATLLFSQGNSPGRSLTSFSQPSASAQATTTVAAADNVRHVADGICWNGGAASAPVATQLTVNLRDGASGAGTILLSFPIVVPATVGGNVTPFCVMGLNIAGSNATAMTLEWSALLTNEFESVNLMYHNTAN